MATVGYPKEVKLGRWFLTVLAALLALFFCFICSHPRPDYRGWDTVTEIDQLEVAIRQFEAKYRMKYLPSSIVLYEEENGWKNDDRSRMLVKRIWPQFAFHKLRDLDHDGDVGEVDPDQDGTPGISLDGSECLVLFLGGCPGEDSGPLDGFSTDPRDPLKEAKNRIGPFFEFNGIPNPPNGRLIDRDNDGFCEFVDPFDGTSYLYFSSYGGKGYRDAEMEAVGFQVYRQKSGEEVAPYCPKSFQIISGGRDGELGIGGHFSPEDWHPLGDDPKREVERDNVTNFSRPCPFELEFVAAVVPPRSLSRRQLRPPTSF